MTFNEKKNDKVIGTKVKAEILSQIFEVSKKIILHLRKDIIGDIFTKRGRKSIKLYYFDQQALFQLIFGTA